jgi:MFS superfamily sulfate permease-like transporter
MECNNFSLFHLFMFSIFKNWKEDLPASFVVFFVALPLCLGVAYASTGDETKLFTGIIAGAIGGIVVGAISNSRLGVSGPAAGLITIVLSAISTLGSYEAFLTAVVIAGILQVIAGSLGFGILSNFFASSVIKGMLAAIGITLILKEVPHAVGYDADFMGDESFLQSDGHNTFSEILFAISKFSPGAIIISVLSLVILLLFELDKFKNLKFTKIIPSALIVVVVGILSNQLFYHIQKSLYLL